VISTTCNSGEETEEAMLTIPTRGRAAIPATSRARQAGHFLVHYFEMCLPMCIGFGLGDLAYFAIAGGFGYSEPFRQLPELSVVVVTFTMTAPMAAWMLYRGMDRRATFEMALVMPVLAVALLLGGWTGVFARSQLPLLEHGLMMPAMLVPMLIHVGRYTGRSAHAHR
jgi:Zn-dependent protease